MGWIFILFHQPFLLFIIFICSPFLILVTPLLVYTVMELRKTYPTIHYRILNFSLKPINQPVIHASIPHPPIYQSFSHPSIHPSHTYQYLAVHPRVAISLTLVLDGEHDEVGLVDEVGGTHKYRIGSVVLNRVRSTSLDYGPYVRYQKSHGLDDNDSTVYCLRKN